MALNNVPLSGQTLNATRQPIQQNFASIDTGFSINHVDFTVPSSGDAGKHKFLQMPEQGSAPTVASNEAGFYAAVGSTSGATELVFRRENNGSSIPITEYESVSATDGWTYLPSGIILKWGQSSFSTASTTVDINGFGPTYSGTPWSVIVTTVQDGVSSGNDFDRTAFFKEFSGTNIVITKKGSSNSCTFKYLIIGI